MYYFVQKNSVSSTENPHLSRMFRDSAWSR